MKTQKFKQSFGLLIVVAVLVGLLTPVLLSQRTSATALAKAYVRLDHLTATTATTGRVCATPSSAGAGTENKVIVTFPTTAATDYTVGASANWTVNTTFESGFAGVAWPGIGTGTAVGKVVTFPSTDLTGTSLYCFNWTNTAALTTSSAGASVTSFGTIETQTSGSVQIDKSYWGATIISGETVVVNAIVAPFFTMALSGSTDTFATNLSSGSVNTSNANNTIQVDTNALNGWILWAKGTNLKTVSDTGSTNSHGALTSVSAGSYAIANNTTNALASPSAAHTFSAGSEDYGLASTINTDGAGGGTVSLDAAYNGTTANQAGVIDPTQYRPIGSSNGTAVADKLNIKMLVTISNSTPPGNDYTDTIRYIGAGQF